MIEIARVWTQLKITALDFAEHGDTLSLARARELARTIVIRECLDRTPLEALDYFAAALLTLIDDFTANIERDARERIAIDA